MSQVRMVRMPKRVFELSNLRSALDDTNLRRKSFEEYKRMNKTKLLKGFNMLIANFDKLRKQYVELRLENNYLNRRILSLTDKINYIQSTNTHRNFKHYYKRTDGTYMSNQTKRRS